MTIPVNIMPFLLIQENQNRALDSEWIEYNQQIAFNQNFSRLPQQEMLPFGPIQEPMN